VSENTTVDTKPTTEVLLPVPADLEARVVKFVAMVEDGEKTATALAECNLTPTQAALVLSRRPELQKRKESVRAALVEKRRVIVEAVEDRAFQQVMGDDEVIESTVTEDGFDKDGAPTTTVTKKTQRRSVSHDNLTIQLLQLDAEHRKAKQGEGNSGPALVAVNVQFNGIDLSAFQRGNSQIVEVTAISIVDAGLLKEGNSEGKGE